MAETTAPEIENDEATDPTAPVEREYKSISHFLESQYPEIAQRAELAAEEAAKEIDSKDLKIEEKLNQIKVMKSEKKSHKEYAEHFLNIAIHEINHYESYTGNSVEVPKYPAESPIIDDLKFTTFLFVFAEQNSIKSEFYGRITAALQSAIAHIEAL